MFKSAKKLLQAIKKTIDDISSVSKQELVRYSDAYLVMPSTMRKWEPTTKTDMKLHLSMSFDVAMLDDKDVSIKVTSMSLQSDSPMATHILDMATPSILKDMTSMMAIAGTKHVLESPNEAFTRLQTNAPTTLEELLGLAPVKVDPKHLN